MVQKTIIWIWKVVLSAVWSALPWWPTHSPSVSLSLYEFVREWVGQICSHSSDTLFKQRCAYLLRYLSLETGQDVFITHENKQNFDTWHLVIYLFFKLRFSYFKLHTAKPCGATVRRAHSRSALVISSEGETYNSVKNVTSRHQVSDSLCSSFVSGQCAALQMQLRQRQQHRQSPRLCSLSQHRIKEALFVSGPDDFSWGLC